MCGVYHEPEPLAHLLGEIAELFGRYLGDVPTPVADKMHMIMRLGGVAGCAVTEVGVSDQIEALKQVEGAVNGGDVNSRCHALDVFADCLRGGVLQLPYRIEHELPLGRHAHPPRVQGPAQAGIHN